MATIRQKGHRAQGRTLGSEFELERRLVFESFAQAQIPRSVCAGPNCDGRDDAVLMFM